MDTIINSASEVLVKQKSAKKTAITIVELLVSILLIVVAVLYIPNTSSALYMLLVTFGGLGLCIFAIRLFVSNNQIIYKPTGSMVVDYSLFFAAEEAGRLIDAVQTGDVSKMPQVSGDNNSGVRLDVLLSQDYKFAACQVFKYIPYNYEAASDIIRVDDDNLMAFCCCIKNISSK